MLSRSDHLYRREAIAYQRRRLSGDVPLEIEARNWRWLVLLVAAHVAVAMLLCIPLPVTVSHDAVCSADTHGVTVEADMSVSGISDASHVALQLREGRVRLSSEHAVVESARPLRLLLPITGAQAMHRQACALKTDLAVRPLVMIAARLRQIL